MEQLHRASILRAPRHGERFRLREEVPHWLWQQTSHPAEPGVRRVTRAVRSEPAGGNRAPIPYSDRLRGRYP